MDELIDARQGGNNSARSIGGLVSRYEAHNGKLVESYFSKKIWAAAVLTDRDDIHIKYPAEAVASLTPQFEHSIWSCVSLSREANEVLEGRELRTVQKVLYSLMVYLLTVLEAQPFHRTSSVRVADGPPAGVLPGEEALKSKESDERIQAALTTANKELERARNHIDNFATREAGKFYILGMFLAIVPLVVIALILGRANMKDWDEQTLLISLVAGGLGAIVSVMSRTMNTDQLKVDYHAGKLLICMGGLFRPIVGALFGLMFYALIGSRLLPVSLPTNPPTSILAPDAKQQVLLFFAGVAFLAGFSERLAQDTLVRTAGGVLGQGNRSGKSELISPKPDSPTKSTDSSN